MALRPERDDRLVLDDEPRVGLAAFGDRGVKRALQVEHRRVAPAPEVDQPRPSSHTVEHNPDAPV